MAIDLALTNRNPANGKFGIAIGADGNLATDDTEEWAVVAALTEKRGLYWNDPLGTHGSRLRDIKSMASFGGSPTPSQAEAAAREALQPLIDARRIKLVELPGRPAVIGSIDRANNRVRVGVTWTRPAGGTPKTTYVNL